PSMMISPSENQSWDGVPFVGGSNSRIASSVSDKLEAAYIIVDVHELGSADWEQLADYLAMIAMGQIDPNADPAGYDSILGLFTAASPPSGLTDWDWSYLHAIYDMNQHILPDAQRGQIVSRMYRNGGAEAE